jgi:DNA (cytosine-5)-methyltransferase 1
MKILDLFSGIGGFSLGLERAGMTTVAFCEIDAKARLVLKKHWPNVPVFEDITTLTKADIHDEIDIIAGGFPCQDISLAGKGAGLAGARSGLWSEFHRLIAEIRPRYAVIENVSALRNRGLDTVLRSLAEIGYDAEWHCIPASAVGAPHRRDRVWIVAHPESIGCNNGDDRKLFGSLPGKINSPASASRIVDKLEAGGWAHEPDVGRVAHGVPKRVDRLKQLGNAVVPQIPELIGRAIMDYENALA